MAEENEQTKESDLFFMSWMKLATNFWSNLAATMPRSEDDRQKVQPATKNRFMEQWQTHLN